GAIGCWGYSLRHRVESLAGCCEAPAGLPDAWIGIYDTLYAFDTRRMQGFLVHVPAPGQAGGRSAARLEQLRASLTIAASSPAPRVELCPTPAGSNVAREGYLSAV